MNVKYFFYLMVSGLLISSPTKLKKELASYENVSKKQFLVDATGIIYNFLY